MGWSSSEWVGAFAYAVGRAPACTQELQVLRMSSKALALSCSRSWRVSCGWGDVTSFTSHPILAKRCPVLQ